VEGWVHFSSSLVVTADYAIKKANLMYVLKVHLGLQASIPVLTNCAAIPIGDIERKHITVDREGGEFATKSVISKTALNSGFVTGGDLKTIEIA
jgi:hypothetical protein